MTHHFQLMLLQQLVFRAARPGGTGREPVDSKPPTCNHASHEFSESTCIVPQLVAPLTARGHWT
jgi:hypothetical protein